MPQTTASVIEELLAFGESALGHILSSRKEMHQRAHGHLRGLAQKMDLVTRDEFDAAMAMIAKARMIQEELKTRLNAIEQKLKMSRTSEKVTQKKQSLRSVKHNKRAKKRIR